MRFTAFTLSREIQNLLIEDLQSIDKNILQAKTKYFLLNRVKVKNERESFYSGVNHVERGKEKSDRCRVALLLYRVKTFAHVVKNSELNSTWRNQVEEEVKTKT